MGAITGFINYNSTFFKDTVNCKTAAELGAIVPRVLKAAFGYNVSIETGAFCEFLGNTKNLLTCTQVFKKLETASKAYDVTATPSALYVAKREEIMADRTTQTVVGSVPASLSEMRITWITAFMDAGHALIKIMKLANHWQLIQPLAKESLKKMTAVGCVIDLTLSIKGMITEGNKYWNNTAAASAFVLSSERGRVSTFYMSSLGNAHFRVLSALKLALNVAVFSLSTLGVAALIGYTVPFAATIELVSLVAIPVISIAEFIYKQRYSSEMQASSARGPNGEGNWGPGGPGDDDDHGGSDKKKPVDSTLVNLESGGTSTDESVA